MKTPWSIPKNWEWTELNAIGDVVSGGTPPTKEPEYWGGNINWISPADLTGYTKKTISKGAKSITKKGLENSSAKMMPAGSVHFSSRAPIGYVVISAEPICTNQGFKSLVPADGIFNEYIYYYFKASKQLAEERATGTTFREISGTAFGKLPIPVAPYNEQHRIVAKIEELFSELDKGIESLKTAREQLKVYRQAVLKHAFEGKLTAKWREENKDKLESPEQLLARIRQEREARYQQQVEQWKEAFKGWEEKGKEGKKPTKPRTPKPVLKLPNDVLDVLPGIPECWVWEKLGWLTCGVEYGTAAKSSDSGSVPVIRMGNIQNGKIDWKDLVFTSDEAEIEKYSLKPGDVLFNRTNSPELVGKSAIYQGERPALFAGYLIRINHIGSAVDGRYLNYFLNSHVAKQYGNSVKTDGVNQSNINGEKLQSYPFPYCVLAEQHEVVRIIEEKLSITDRFLGDIKAQLDKAETLRQSILKKAFSGQLVSQDSNDEPASILLERIRAEKAKQAPKPRRKRKPRKAASA